MVDLMKFLLNGQPLCANYLNEEFCNKNTIIEYLMNCPVYEIKKLIVGILYCAMIKSINDYEISIKKNKSDKKKQNNNKLLREINDTSSNLISYIEKNKLYLFSKKNKPNIKANQNFKQL